MQVRRHRILAVFVACTMLGFLGFVASPGAAHDPTFEETHHPGDGGGGHSDLQTDVTTVHKDPGDTAGIDPDEEMVLSDASVGVGTGAALRGTAEPTEADFGFGQWYDCLAGEDPADVTPPPDECTHVAVDTTADPVPLPTGFSPADDGVAFSAFWDISQSSDAAQTPAAGRDVFFVPCLADADQGGVPYDTPHCSDASSTDVHVDNAAAGHPATTNGRIQQIITAAGTFTANQSGSFDTHGAGLKNNEDVTLVVYTSGATPDAIHACIDNTITQVADDNDSVPAGDGTGCNIDETDDTPDAGGTGCTAVAGAHCWSILLDELLTDDLMALKIVEYDDGSAGGTEESGNGDCEGDVESGSGDDCVLDEVVLSTTAAGEAPGIVGPPPPPPPPPPTCPGRRISGNARSNTLRGTCGPDKMFGKAGNDRLRGKAGNDLLNGGKHFDRCRGGPGRDRFKRCELKKQ
jgi:hypothetical protein